MASLVILVGLSYFLFGDGGASGPSQVALTVATMIAVLVAWRRGHSLARSMRRRWTASAPASARSSFCFAVGALIGTWAMSGTLVAMVYYGIQILSPNYFYLTTAVVCAVISSWIGSSWTTAGTIGVGFMGIAVNMGLDPAITAAAIISGAYFGDTTSPLSDSTNLASGTAGVGLYQHIRETALSSVDRAARCRWCCSGGWASPATSMRPTRSSPSANSSPPRRCCSCRWCWWRRWRC